MIDPMISLAISMHSNKGVYALLLGSGVSRPANIPTGWGIALDLIRKVAHLKGANCEPDPLEWYRAEFGDDPDYVKLVKQFASSPEEHAQLLRPYFEPTPEERERGEKAPTEAHRAIADLVAQGYIRVIVTTNYDHLLEQAIEAVGVTPTVLSTVDEVKGTVPLQHTACTILKVNGDYTDGNIKASPKELAKYDSRVNRLLDRIFDEYGLIVSGWSGDWEPALCRALQRTKNQRFTTYWVLRDEPTETAKKLIQHRRASTIQVRDASSFFRDLADKVAALAEFPQHHPLSASVAVATLKKYLSDPRDRIRLYDLMKDETDRLLQQLSGEKAPAQAEFSDAELHCRIQRYESMSDVVLHMMIAGGYWGEEPHKGIWVRGVERVVNVVEARGDSSLWIDLQRYPALLLYYGVGIAAIAAHRYRTLASLLMDTATTEQGNEVPLPLTLNAWTVIRDAKIGHHLPGMAGKHTPLSEHLYAQVREPLREFLPRDTAYARAFDRFEYFLTLAYVDLYATYVGPTNQLSRPPVGRFGVLWHRRVVQDVEAEVRAMGRRWPPLVAGLFDGSPERFKAAKITVDSVLQELPWF